MSKGRVSQTLRVGAVLYGFCEGAFGRDSYGKKLVEGVGDDWVVARDLDDGIPVLARCDPESLLKFRTPPEDDSD